MCIVESVTDLFAMEKAGVYHGKYHILMGKLSPVRGIGPEQLNLQKLASRIDEEQVEEVILALSNDMEGEATCYYLKNEVFKNENLKVTRIGFGLPSGRDYCADEYIANALQSRRLLDSWILC